MKRKLISALLVSVMTISLAACGTGGGSSEGGEGGSGSSEGGHKLTVYAWDPAFNIPAIEAAAADYKENVDSEFELEILEQAASEDVETAITTAGSSGDYSNLPDIVLFQDHYIQRYVADYPDAWTPLGDVDINWDDFAAEKLDYSTIDGEHYGVPVDNGTVVAAYRTDLLEQAGYTIDDLTGCTWDKFIEIGKAVYEKTGKALLCMNSDGNDLPYIMMQAEGVSQFKDGKPYITENETLVTIVEKLVEMAKENVLLMPNSWSDYTDKAIQGDQVAGVMNGNWIIPTIEKVEANSGKWAITSMPTLEGGEGYASNGGSSLYITSNCQNVDLAKDFLAYTFGGSTTTYDNALKDGGVISTYAPAGETEVYNEGVEYFNNQPIYADIVEMGTHVQTVEQSDYHYSARNYVGSAIVNIINGADTMDALQEAEDQLNFEMGN
ncbi:sugar ABC transporter substrate-binding protein [Drancourtella massiliensis]|uniref:ABC transporter substrate-binding protein n=2 Tax=Clostridia TaxID=186801 RepID=A0A9W6C5A5_9FIRM|nr:MULTISPECIES: extracellular solute-binding protein [Clostridia]MBM6745195.1 sugar ABC transporter substrate-binding protein [Drancourtella massiliensis]RHV34913.1 sugar ABC transporter substrate-binding protein [Ruminococcus sp. OM05-10BH]GLG04002.1 ABC transporter substrate-binding protein [Sellimonas catena]